MDFSTLERRRAACEAEIEVNKANAPKLYLNSIPIVRGANGLSLGGDGEIVEWAVHMRRFDENSTLDKVAERKGLTTDVIKRLARAVVRSHERAPRRDGAAATEQLKLYIEQNDASFAADPSLFDPERVKLLASGAQAALSAVRLLLIARGQAGYVRRCHGDLHLRNLALIDGEPTLFDAIEFDDAIATGDVLYDFAFLLMDLEERGFRPQANTLFNRYIWLSDDSTLSGLAALPIFLSIRAAIRAKVIAPNLNNLSGEDRNRATLEACRYFSFAEDFLTPRPARLVAIGGLSGTGKSALAGEIAPTLGLAPGAVWLRSDIERKHLFNAQEADHLPAAAYSEAAGHQVYDRVRRLASQALKAGQSVVIDAVHATVSEQKAVEAVAADLDVAFTGLWLEVPFETRLRRIGMRTNDASDADATVARSQVANEPGTFWRRLDAAGDLASITAAAVSILRP
jgi:aminoglycoside phosphotransferase family enzyme/predicted kinase